MERECANPRCFRILSDRLPNNQAYCGNCQLQLRKIVLVFPDGDLGDIVFLLEHGWANLKRVARLLGLERKAVRQYRKKGLMKFIQQGKYAVVSMEELLGFALWKRNLLTMSQAARLLRVSYNMLVRLVSLKIVSPDFQLGNRIKYFDRRNLAEKRKAIRTWQSQTKTRRVTSSQAPVGSDEFSTQQMATILGMSLQGLWYHIDNQSLSVFKRGENVFATKEQFRNFCQSVVDKTIRTIGFTRAKAKEHLDSIAAGQK